MTLMDSTGQADAASDESDAIARHRGSRTPKIIALVIFVAIGAMVSAIIWAMHYQPLGSDYFSYAPYQATSQVGQRMNQFTQDVVTTGTQWVVSPTKVGASYGFQTDLVNTGSFPVTITGVDFSSGANYWPAPGEPQILKQTSLAAVANYPPGPNGPQAGLTRGAGWVPVGNIVDRPQPSDSPTRVWLRVYITHVALCPKGWINEPVTPTHGFTTVTDYKVTYKFLWFHHTVTLPLMNKLALIDSPSCSRTTN